MGGGGTHFSNFWDGVNLIREIIEIANKNHEYKFKIWVGLNFPCKNQNKGIRIPQLAKITTLSRDWWRSLNEKRGNYLTAQKGKGTRQTLTVILKMPR